MKPMNDPHVTALHYRVEHDDSVDYDNAVPLDYEDDHVEVNLEKRQLTLRPKEHYASAVGLHLRGKGGGHPGDCLRRRPPRSRTSRARFRSTL